MVYRPNASSTTPYQFRLKRNCTVHFHMVHDHSKLLHMLLHNLDHIFLL